MASQPMMEPDDPISGTWFDRDEAERRKTEGMARAGAAATRQWREDAEIKIELLAYNHPYVCSDMVWMAGLPKPTNSKTALGICMLALSRAGVLVNEDRTVKTWQVSQHGTPIQAWKSAVYVGQPMTFVDWKRWFDGEGKKWQDLQRRQLAAKKAKP